jgi:hypothetical protein
MTHPESHGHAVSVKLASGIWYCFVVGLRSFSRKAAKDYMTK